MSGVVLSDAQMGMFKVLRPMNNFQEVYQGQAGTIPIAFPCDLDPNAGDDGYDANLLVGVAVPLGGRLLIQIPMTIDQYVVEPDYQYQFIWRTRNQAAVVEAIAAGRQPSAYHLPSEAFGRKEIQTGPATTERFFIPAASDVEVFEQAEPGGGAATLNVKQQRYVPQITVPWVKPLLPTGSGGVWQQGVYQFSSNVNCSGPTFAPLWTDAGGDELLILCYKIASDVAWDFAGVDQGFSNTYGNNDGGLPFNPNIGIIVSSGTMGG